MISTWLVSAALLQVGNQPPAYSYDFGTVDANSMWRYHSKNVELSRKPISRPTIARLVGGIETWKEGEMISIKQAMDASRLNKSFMEFGRALEKFMKKRTTVTGEPIPGVFYANLVARKWRDEGQITEKDYMQLIPNIAQEQTAEPAQVDRDFRTMLRINATVEGNERFGEARKWALSLKPSGATEGELYAACLQFGTGIEYKSVKFDSRWDKFKEVFPVLEQRFPKSATTLALKCSYVMMFRLRVTGAEFDNYFASDEPGWKKARMKWKQAWWGKLISDAKRPNPN
jgi:hypothetical protein